MLGRLTLLAALTSALAACGGPPSTAPSAEPATPAPDQTATPAHPPAVGDRLDLDVMLFEAGSPTLKPESYAAIEEALAGWPLWTLIQIESISDAGPVLRPHEREELPRARGEAIRRVLTRLGYEVVPVRTSAGSESLGRIRLTALATETRAGSRVDLGFNLFKSGSPEFAPGAVENIRSKVRGWPAAMPFDVEVYADRPPGGGRFGRREELLKERGAAVRRVLESLGYRVRKVDPIGNQTRRGKPPSRRVELVAAGLDTP